MRKKQRHCKAITAAPSVASTPLQIKLDFVADALTFVESVYRSGAWGILYGKGGTGS